MSPWTLFKPDPNAASAARLYDAIVTQARQPDFYVAGGVPDSIDGRFEMIALHMFLVLNRLKAEHAATDEFAQALFDAMFADLDRGLREMGATDMGVGKRVKEMATGFYGRVAAYEKGLTGDDATLTEALKRNLYGTVQPTAQSLSAMVRYMRAQAQALMRQPVKTFFSDRIQFSSVSH